MALYPHFWHFVHSLATYMFWSKFGGSMCLPLHLYYSCIDFVLILAFDFCRMPPKRTSKGKEKVGSTSGTRDSATGFRRFLNSETSTRYSDIISHWAIIPERPVWLSDFPAIELATLIQNCGWDKLIERPHPVYEDLAREFYANFNNDIDTPGSSHSIRHGSGDSGLCFPPRLFIGIISSPGTMWSLSLWISIGPR